MSTETTSSTKVITRKVRLSYAHIWHPSAIDGGDKKKYSTALIIDKSDKATLDDINKAVDAAKAAGKANKWGGKLPKNLKLPLRDGDEEKENDPAYENCFFLNATSNTKPGIVDKNREPITEEDEVYSGCFVYASLNFYPFSVNGNNGVACGLNNIMKVKDGEPLAGGSSAEDDFAEVTVEEEDDDL